MPTGADGAVQQLDPSLGLVGDDADQRGLLPAVTLRRGLFSATSMWAGSYATMCNLVLDRTPINLHREVAGTPKLRLTRRACSSQPTGPRVTGLTLRFGPPASAD